MIDDEDILKVSKEEIEEFNKKAEEIDFSQPFFLNSFYRADGYNIMNIGIILRKLNFLLKR